MRQITVNDKSDIKQLLYGECVLGIRDNNCHTFGGFELWWYDREHDICRCCRSRWSDFRKQMEEHTLDHAATLLWHHRNTLFLRRKAMSQDRQVPRMAV